MTPKYREQLWSSVNPNLLTVRELIIDYERTSADRDRLAERVKELSEALGKCDAARSKAVLERKDLELRLASYEDEHKKNRILSEEAVALTERLATADADNAALLKYIENSSCDLGCKSDEREGIIGGDVSRCDRCTILTSAHPGTALTQRLAGMARITDEFVQLLQNCEAISEDNHEQLVTRTLPVLCDKFIKAQQALEGKE